MSEAVYDRLIEHIRQTALLGSCANLLAWDEQTYLPPKGGEHRANQMALLAGMVHERATAPQLGEWLSELEQSQDVEAAGSPRAANLRETRRVYDRATKLPRRLVEELSRVRTLAQQAWVEARKASDFAMFQPWLEQLVTLKREQAAAIGFEGTVAYDALLDEYEPGMKSAQLAEVFAPLREALVELVAQIRDSGREGDIALLKRSYPIDAQQSFGRGAAAAIGFDFEAGRIDEAAHPFCEGIGPGDCRLTTRYDERWFPQAFFGTLHEAGHGLYEQGLPREAFGTPMGQWVSLGLHESQSRMWENFVGRSRAFWQHFFGPAQQAFPAALGDVSLDAFYAAVNDVRPSFIRVEADEVTYNLHIMLRFDLERALIGGDLSAADVPAAWNETFEAYLGLRPPDDAAGCLQDIHWSAGLMGYFPTYALGNVYAAQLFETADRAVGGLHGQFSRGEFGPLLEWLRENIHRRGQLDRARRLIEVVTGQSLTTGPLLNHLRTKFGELYGL